ncbi:hypothetical protein BSLA_01f3265 [Burkholderia stabilis]|nr:hypothetical protein BSLA_01f3265 [Burkholderia stabilis]
MPDRAGAWISGMTPGRAGRNDSLKTNELEFEFDSFNSDCKLNLK